MKVRNGFVSNSSSSSFICEICGADVTGFDMCLDEAEMIQCINGHTICNEHMLMSFTEEDEGRDDCCYDVPEKYCPICQYQELSYSDARSFLIKKYGVLEDVVFAKIKELNKRRKKLYDEEYVEYVFKAEGLDDTKFMEMIKNDFPSYSDYMAYKG